MCSRATWGSSVLAHKEGVMITISVILIVVFVVDFILQANVGYAGA